MFFTTLALHNLILLYDGRDKFDEESGEDGANGEDSSDEDIPNRPPSPPSAALVIEEVIVNEVDVQEEFGANGWSTFRQKLGTHYKVAKAKGEVEWLRS